MLLRPKALLVISMMALTFTLDHHELWLLYDFSCMAFLLVILRNGFLTNAPALFIGMLSVYLLYAFGSILEHGMHFISILSIWDTLKHLTVTIFLFGTLVRNGPDVPSIQRTLSRMLLGIFLIQVPLVYIQYKGVAGGLDFDNVAGTFGDGSSHALAYLSAAVASVAWFGSRSQLLRVVTLLLSLLLNYWAENVGGYILLFCIIGFWIVRSRKTILLSAIGVVPALLAALVLLGSQSAVLNKQLPTITGRISDVTRGFSSSNGPTGSGSVDATHSSRGDLMRYAIVLGGAFGRGFGAYSDIYKLHGWEESELLNQQVDINEFSHIVSEEGLVGCALLVLTFLSLAAWPGLNTGLRAKYVTLFVICFIYNRFLMDERMYFYFICAIYLTVRPPRRVPLRREAPMPNVAPELPA
jgi:hypothetical protein